MATNAWGPADGLLVLTSSYFQGRANDGFVGRCSTHFGQVATVLLLAAAAAAGSWWWWLHSLQPPIDGPTVVTTARESATAPTATASSAGATASAQDVLPPEVIHEALRRWIREHSSLRGAQPDGEALGPTGGIQVMEVWRRYLGLQGRPLATRVSLVDLATWRQAQAQRLATQRAAWASCQTRLAQAQREWRSLQGDPTLSDMQRRAALDAFIGPRFDTAEQRRVRALLGVQP